MNKRSGIIDLEKFIFSIIIVLHHAELFYNDSVSSICVNGYIAVEFYFIVSGYLLAEKASRYRGDNIFDDNLRFFVHRIGRLFPYIFLASLTGTLFYTIGNYNFKLLYQDLFLSIVDVLGLQMLGFNGFIATGVSWYISVLLIVSFIIYPLLCKKRELFTKYIAPFSAMFILGYICHISVNLSNPGQWYGLVFKGLLRGYADIAIGCSAYELRLLIDKLPNTRFNSALLTIFELFGMSIVIIYAIFHKKPDIYDFFMIPIILFSVSVSFSTKSIGEMLKFTRVFNRLGIFSLSIYLNHFYVKENLTRLFPIKNKYQLLFAYIIIVMVLAFANYFVGSALANKKARINKYVIIVGVFALLFFICSKYEYIMQKYYVKVAGFEGKGTEDNPYLISDKNDLKMLGVIVNKGGSFEGNYFLQTNNIDLKNEEWIPIGVFGSGKYFDGVYNGANHYLSNLTITDTSTSEKDNNGLFGLLEGEVKNLGIESGNITGDYVGAIASHGGDNALILNCYNKASVIGNYRAGGICDNFNNGNVVCCINTGDVFAPTSAQILSYDSSNVVAVYPVEGAITETFTGNFVPMNLNGNDVTEILNSGIEQLITDGYIKDDDVSKW